MKVVSTVQGVIRNENPRQGLNDLKAAGFENLFVDLDQFYPKQENLISLFFEKAKECGLDISLVKAPELLYDVKRKEKKDDIPFLAKESVKLCGKYGVQKLIVSPLEDDYEKNKKFYTELLQLAKENHITILIENSCKNVNGHFNRGMFSNPEEVKDFIAEFGTENFSFVFNQSNMNLSGQNPLEYLNELKGYVDAVILSDNDGDQDAKLLPFTSNSIKGSNVDWTSLVRGVRACDFDGDIILDYADTALFASPYLKPDLLSYVKKTGDYFKWQFEMERMIQKYPSRVLFGAGNMCRNYMLNYGKEYPPLFTCDNNSSIWGTTFEGLEVKNPEELKNLSKDTAVLICNVYYREIEAQLRDMGIENPIERFNDEFLPRLPFKRLDMTVTK